MTKPIRVLLAKPTHDCHDRGVRYLARKLSQAGMEVIFINFLLASEVVDTAVEEDVDVVGISASAGGHMPVFEDLAAAVSAGELLDVMLLAGGVIPPADAQALKSLGVAEVFGPGSDPDAAIRLIRERVTNA